MKKAILSLLIFGFALGCNKSGPHEAYSPNRTMKVRTEISGDAAELTRRLRVILIFEDSDGKEKRIQTGASDTMKWAIGWHDEDTLVLSSSDVGITAYDLDGLSVSERNPSEEEMKTGREAYRRRYD